MQSIQSKFYPYIIFTIALIFLGWNTGDYLLMDLDEPRYPEAAREMIEYNQYIVPMTNGHFLYEKPILIYWSQILSFKFFGVTEFAARLPSVIAGTLTTTAAYIFGRFFKAGIATSLILMTSIEFFIISRLSIPDMLLNFFVISSLALYFLISEGLVHKNYSYLLAVSISLGFLTKGPLAIFVPGLVISSFTLYEHFFTERKLSAKLSVVKENLSLILKSVIIFILLGGSWYLSVHFATNGGFTKQFFITENFQRYTSTLTGHHFPWWFYGAVTLIGFMPWSIFIPNYLAKAKSNILGNKSTARVKIFSIIWVLSTVLFFSTSGTKLYNYIFSIFFPLAVLFGLWFAENSEKEKKSIFINSLVLVSASIGMQTLHASGNFDGVIASNSFLASHIKPGTVYYGTALVFLMGFTGIVASSLKFKLKNYFYIFSFITMLLCLFAVQNIIMPFSNFKVGGIKNFVTQIPKDAKVYKIKMDRPSVSFYFKAPTEVIGMKKLRKRISSEKLCFISQKNKLEKIKTLKAIHIWNIDDLYVYGCNFQPIKPNS